MTSDARPRQLSAPRVRILYEKAISISLFTFNLLFNPDCHSKMMSLSNIYY